MKAAVRSGSASSVSDKPYVTNSVAGHIVRLAGTTYIGLFFVNIVDVLALFYLSVRSNGELLAGLGAALSFYLVGVMLAVSAGSAITIMASIKIGGIGYEGTKSAISTLIGLTVAGSILCVIAMYLALPYVWHLYGIEGSAIDVATHYSTLILPTNILLAFIIASTAAMRSAGQMRPAMNVTLLGALVAGIADPILILGLDGGLSGAAAAIWVSRVAQVALSLVYLAKVMRLPLPEVQQARVLLRPLLLILAPVTVASLAAPLSMAALISILSGFGPTAIGAFVVFDRVAFLLFGAMFALPGAVSAVVGQNLGAAHPTRVRSAVLWGCGCVTGVGLMAGLMLVLCRMPIAAAFSILSTPAWPRFEFLSFAGGALWIAIGMCTLLGAVFQTFGHSRSAMVIGWGRALCGVLPAWIAAAMGASFETTITAFVLGQCLFAAFVGLAAIKFLRGRMGPRPESSNRIAESL